MVMTASNNRMGLRVLHVTKADWLSIRSEQRKMRISDQFAPPDAPFGDYCGLPLQIVDAFVGVHDCAPELQEA